MNKKENFNGTGFILMLLFVFVMYQIIIKTQNLYLISVMVLGGITIQFIFNKFIKFDFFNRKGERK